MFLFAAFMVVSGAVAVGLSHVDADSEGIGFVSAFLFGLCCGSALPSEFTSTSQIKQVTASADLIGCRADPMSATKGGLLSIGLLAAYIASVALVIMAHIAFSFLRSG